MNRRKELRRPWISDKDAERAFKSGVQSFYLATVLLFFGLLLWIIVSDAAFGDPDLFQRAGSLGVALAVVSFAFARIAAGKLDSVFARSEIYESLERDFFLLQQIATENKTELSEHSGASKEYLFRPLSRPLYTDHSGGTLHANTLASLEVGWFVVATLQWGYGDFFVCWINGNGWTTC